MRSIVSLLLAVLITQVGAAQETKKPPSQAGKLTALEESYDKVMALGKLAERPMTRLRRDQAVKAAVAVMRKLSKTLRKSPKPETDPGKDAVMEVVKGFTKELGEFVALGAEAVPATQAAVTRSQDGKRAFFESVASRLFVQEALVEIGSYVKGSRTPGTFDGMFPEMEKHGRKGADAFLDIFTDIDQRLPDRSLGGEGVAQLASKGGAGKLDDAARAMFRGRIQEIWDDTLEDQNLRHRAKVVLARLGDPSLIEKDIAKADAALVELKKKLADKEKTFRKLREEVTELEAVAEPTDEQKKRLEELSKEVRTANGELVNLILQTGGACSSRAVFFQDLRKTEETEQCYVDAIKQWLRVAGVLRRQERLRSMINVAYYNLACVQSLQGKTKPAYDAMEQCFRWGYRNFDWAMKDGDLAALRAKEPAFGKLVEEVRSGKAAERWKKEDAKKGAAKPDGEKPSGSGS